MARPNLRIDVIKRVGKPIAFSVNDRLAIEAKYGHKLTSEQWKQITDVTSVLTIYIPGINVASSARLVLSKFKKLEAAAKSLRSEFSKTPDYEIFTPQEIYWTFFARRQRPPRLSEEFQFLEDILGAVTKFSEFAVQQLQKPNPKQSNHWFTLSESDVWNIWVNELTEVADARPTDRQAVDFLEAARAVGIKTLPRLFGWCTWRGAFLLPCLAVRLPRHVRQRIDAILRKDLDLKNRFILRA